MKIKARNKTLSSFSLSGMTDIVFLLLLFFMLTSTLVAPNALKLLIPQAGQSTGEEQRYPEVSLHQSGAIIVDGKSVSFEQLEPVLIRKLSGQADPTIKLITASDVTVRETVKVMNVAARNNYKVVLLKK